MTRVDEFGRAYAGSQLQIQTYVNRKQGDLDAAILKAFPELAEHQAWLEWVCPLESQRFVEYQDDGFLAALRIPQFIGQLSKFWPQGGPRWDALAKVHRQEQSDGVLLVEAKSYPKEMLCDGCRASEESRSLIVKSLERTRGWLNATPTDWTGQFYQYANRLAHVYFLREICGIPTWFVNVCFAADPHSPTPRAVWGEALRSAKESLGLGLEVKFCADVVLDAAGRELFQTPARVAGRAVGNVSYVAGKEWRFLNDDVSGKHQFLAFANARGSSSMRCFDAESGLQIGDTRLGRKRPYQEAFAHMLTASKPIDGPAAVSNPRIEPADLKAMRAQVGLPENRENRPDISQRQGILSGVDDLVDGALCIKGIGKTSPHYRHLTSYQVVASRPAPNGTALIQEAYSRIVSNWPGTRCRSAENWRWEKRPYIREDNSSPEKRFEKAIAQNCGEWYNMIPVASGILPDVEEGGRRIDLARQSRPGGFELIELKVGPDCDTPLHAAIEILGYGLIYVFSRMHCEQLGYDRRNILLSANRITLIALAPQISYLTGSLALFEVEINRGLVALIRKYGIDDLTMDFQFEQLSADFDLEIACKSPCEAINLRSCVYGTEPQTLGASASG